MNLMLFLHNVNIILALRGYAIFSNNLERNYFFKIRLKENWIWQKS